MKIRSLFWILAGIVAMTGICGCGGSSGGGGGGPSSDAKATMIKGTASAGILYPGNIFVYAIDQNGNKGGLLSGPVETDLDGKYSAQLGSYSGAILIEASGTYTDEATGNSVTIPPSNPLRAMVDQVDNGTYNNRTVAVTPLTELAWRQASASGTRPVTAAEMVSANKLINDLFKVSDIIGIEPVRADNFSMADASQKAQTYTLALAGLSQMASTAAGETDQAKLENMLKDMVQEVKSAAAQGVLGAAATQKFADALKTVSLGDDFPAAKEQLFSIGKGAPQKLILSISGALPQGVKIYAIQGSITLPPGVSLRADSNGQVLPNVFLSSATAGEGGFDPLATYLEAQQQVDFSVVFSPSGPGIDAVDFAELNYDVTSGLSISAADFLAVSGTVAIKGSSGTDLEGLSLVLK